MSLILERGSKPPGLVAKTFGGGTLGTPLVLWLGDYEISLEDFLALAEYVLTNSDLIVNDPRLQFVNLAKSASVVGGWNPGYKRLQLRFSG